MDPYAMKIERERKRKKNRSSFTFFRKWIPSK